MESLKFMQLILYHIVNLCRKFFFHIVVPFIILLNIHEKIRIMITEEGETVTAGQRRQV